MDHTAEYFDADRNKPLDRHGDHQGVVFAALTPPSGRIEAIEPGTIKRAAFADDLSYSLYLDERNSAETKELRALQARIEQEQAQPTDETALREAVAESISSLYGCERTWRAWSVGTMTEDDFYNAGECDECIDQVMDAIRPFIGARAAQPQAAIQAPELAELRRLAEAASEGDWMAAGPSFGAALPKYLDSVECGDDSGEPTITICDAPDWHVDNYDQRSANIEYIAAVNPASILRLLDALAAPAPTVDAPSDLHFRSRVADLLHLLPWDLSFADRDKSTAESALADIRRALAAPTGASQSAGAVYMDAAWEAFQNTPVDLCGDSDAEQRKCVENAVRAYIATPPAAMPTKATLGDVWASGGVHWDLFPGYLIDHEEGGRITEEGLQFALASMLKDADYLRMVGERAAMPAQASVVQPIGYITTGDIEYTSDGAEIGGWDVDWDHKVIDAMEEFAQPETTYSVYLGTPPAPSPAIQAQPLTDADIVRIACESGRIYNTVNLVTEQGLCEFARRIERHLAGDAPAEGA